VGALQLLTHARDHMQGDAKSKGVNLVLVADEGFIDGDESLLTAALVNLVKNAIQAAPKETTVTLRGRADGTQYLVEVLDEGPGIPTDEQEQIFEPFFTTREKGTGLGLPLAKKIVQAHRGVLSVQSKPGETRFSIQLPLSAAS
jgi:signal transduction histidine kinase